MHRTRNTHKLITDIYSYCIENQMAVSRLMANAERALVPYNPERGVVPYNPERALVPYNPERALIPYSQERGLVPLVRGDVYHGAIVRPSFYDSFNQHLMFRGRNDVISFVCIFKSFMGCGIFAMPAAFMHGGTWWTLMHLLAFAGILYGCIYMLVNCAHTLESRYRIPVLSYSQLGMTAVVHGPPFLSGFYQIPKHVINFFQFFASICLCGLYVMFITHNMCDLGDFLVPSNIIDFKMWRPFVLVVAVALILPCILCYLNLYCLLGTLAQLMALGLGFINYVFADMPEPSEIETAFLPEKNIQFVFLMCGIIMYLIEGITAIMPIENTMNNPRHLIGCPSVLLTGMLLVTAFKAVVGLTGHMKYKSQTLPFITSNMPKDNIGCCFTFLGIIMPACIELCVHYREYGVFKWRLVLSTALVLFGLALAGALTYGSIGSWLVHVGKSAETEISNE
uniref:Amino acid transporter transmembrane domain-containing protein n=1 Tax=Glossina palpalis gambiensis TaxID=67801 RepID=A0A1B0B930_9MUSC